MLNIHSGGGRGWPTCWRVSSPVAGAVHGGLPCSGFSGLRLVPGAQSTMRTLLTASNHKVAWDNASVQHCTYKLLLYVALLKLSSSSSKFDFRRQIHLFNMRQHFKVVFFVFFFFGYFFFFFGGNQSRDGFFSAPMHRMIECTLLDASVDGGNLLPPRGQKTSLCQFEFQMMCQWTSLKHVFVFPSASTLSLSGILILRFSKAIFPIQMFPKCCASWVLTHLREQ